MARFPRLLRAFRPLLLFISALLFLITMFAWFRSHHTLDEFSYVDDQHVTHSLVSFQGQLHLSNSGIAAASHPISHGSYPFRDDADLNCLYSVGTIEYDILGFMSITTSPTARPGTALTRVSTAATRPTFQRLIVPWINCAPFTAHVIPYWPFAILFFVLPARLLFVSIRRHHRKSRHHCPNCNYDLRATPTHCPECGMAYA